MIDYLLCDFLFKNLTFYTKCIIYFGKISNKLFINANNHMKKHKKISQ